MRQTDRQSDRQTDKKQVMETEGGFQGKLIGMIRKSDSFIASEIKEGDRNDNKMPGGLISSLAYIRIHA